MTQKKPGDIRPAEPMETCPYGHRYPRMAGACPYDDETPSATALDAKGEERIGREGDRGDS